MNKGEFLGVKAGGMDWDWAAQQTGLLASIMIHAGVSVRCSRVWSRCVAAYTINTFLGAGPAPPLATVLPFSTQFSALRPNPLPLVCLARPSLLPPALPVDPQLPNPKP